MILEIGNLDVQAETVAFLTAAEPHPRQAAIRHASGLGVACQPR